LQEGLLFKKLESSKKKSQSEVMLFNAVLPPKTQSKGSNPILGDSVFIDPLVVLV
jgi:hypothetical protein